MIISNRELLKKEFLDSLPFRNDIVDIKILKSDASFRRYSRIFCSDRSFILMDAPPDKEKVLSFTEIGKCFLEAGFTVPEIYFSDISNGFLLLEDIGLHNYKEELSENFSDLKKKSEKEKNYYMHATEVLLELHKKPLFKKLPLYSEDILFREYSLFVEYFLNLVLRESQLDTAREEYLAIFEDLLKFIKISENVVVHRDYHADNLIWCENRKGIKKVGILDFQDAVAGPPAYDVISLLKDARRDVDKEVYESSLNFYIENNRSVNRDDFLRSCSVLSAQRNCKIVGIFIRIAKNLNRFSYLEYLPRVWDNIFSDIEHPALIELKLWFNKYISKEFCDIDFLKEKILSENFIKG